LNNDQIENDRAVHDKVVQQRNHILKEAFNNPIEAFLEYEPWAVSVNNEDEHD